MMTRRVSTFDELNQAALEFRTAPATKPLDLHIIVEGEIDMGGRNISFTGPVSGNAMYPNLGTVVLEGRDGAIRFNMIPPGDTINWGTNPQAVNGMEFRCEHAGLMALALSDYEWMGSAIRAGKVKSWSLDSCDFANISRRSWNPRIPVPASSADVWIGQAVGGGDGNTNTNLKNCIFDKCAWSDISWAHCIYVGGRRIEVDNCVFADCGQALAPQAVAGSHVVIVENHMLPSLWCTKRGNAQSPQPPYLLNLVDGASYVVTGNKFHGQFSTLYLNNPNPDKMSFSKNDYSRATCQTWGNWTREQWVASGLDEDSAF